jgi:SSS family transporter
MTTLDWVVLFGWLIFLVSYGLWRGRDSSSVNQFLLAGKTMPWYAMGLSIMATQASAITFISTTGQAYVDGMRFVQFYFGLPLAMVILSATAVPIFHRAKVYTAYEYLEQRFDAKTRSLVTLVFLIQRGLGAGIALAAPAIVMSVILGWSFHVTTIVMGALVIFYTTTGGIKAVTWADVLQMSVIMAALALALAVVVWKLPSDVSFFDAVKLAGAAGRLNAVDTHFDWNNRYNLWSGLIGSGFLMLAYFGTDQSQVQRYLTGRSIGQSRLGLLFNAVAKVPVQFFILFIGAMVFVFFLFVQPPLLFHPLEMQRVRTAPEYTQIEARYNQAFEQRQSAARSVIRGGAIDEFRAAQKNVDDARAEMGDHLQRRLARAHGVVGLERRRVPEGHDRVAHVFIDRAVARLYEVGHRRQEAVHEAGQALRIELLGDAREAAHVGEHHGDLALLSAQRQEVGIAHHRLDLVRRQVEVEGAADLAPVALGPHEAQRRATDIDHRQGDRRIDRVE